MYRTLRILLSIGLRIGWSIKRFARKQRTNTVPALARGVAWDSMPKSFRTAHHQATQDLASETDLRELALRMSRSRSTIQSLWRIILCLLLEIAPSLRSSDTPEDASLILDLDDTGRVWAITRDCPSLTAINAGFGALADGVSVLMDPDRHTPVGAAMYEDSLRPLRTGKRIEIRITCRSEIDSDD